MLDNNSKFSYVPGTRASRSIFDLSNSVKTSFDAAQLVPFYYEEVLQETLLTWKLILLPACRLLSPL